MTYIIGFRQPGINAILADTLVTRRSVDGVVEERKGDLKTGLLFRGCIYGSTGSVGPIRQFVTGFQRIDSRTY